MKQGGRSKAAGAFQVANTCFSCTTQLLQHATGYKFFGVSFVASVIFRVATENLYDPFHSIPFHSIPFHSRWTRFCFHAKEAMAITVKGEFAEEMETAETGGCILNIAYRTFQTGALPH